MTEFHGRVLLLDRCRDNCDSMKMLLKLGGADAHSAYDVPTALAMARDLAPDVVIAEIARVDGCSLARQLRADQQQGGSRKGRVVIVAYSGSANERDRERALAAGFDEYFVKPHFADLWAQLDRLVEDADEA